MSEASPKSQVVFTVPSGRSFLRSLADAILAGDLPRRGGAKPTPLELANMTLLLPTRRAARALGEAFLDAAGGKAMLLPRIRPISEGQDDLTLLSADISASFDNELEIAPAIGELERRLILTALVLRWSKALRGGARTDEGTPYAAAGASTPAQAANLAAELAQLMDMVETEGASLAELAKLVPEDFASHWADTLQFLDIAVAAWPAILEEKGKLAPAARRNKVIEAEAERLLERPPDGPVIVAGVTGSIPATRTLMSAVTKLKQGAIVLPALDTTIVAAEAIEISKGHPEHPQFGLVKLLQSLGLSPEDVGQLASGHRSQLSRARERLVSEAMRPASRLEDWQRYVGTVTADEMRAATQGVSLIEAPTADREAEAIALILRHAVETPARTAAVVSPDRLLARRIVNRLETMGIAVDDSAGRPLAKTPPGTFLNLVADCWAHDFAPVALMALLRHPLLRLGRSVRDVRRAARALELTIFRAPYLGRGLDGVLAAIDAAEQDIGEGKRRHRVVRRVRDEDLVAVRRLVQDLAAAYAPLLDCGADADGAASLKSWAQAHVAVAEALSITRDDAASDTPPATVRDEDATAPPHPLWDGDAGLAAQRFFNELFDEAVTAPELRGSDYPEFYRGLTSGINVRPRLPAHPRISIWGPFEARLQQPDVIVLAGLNDGTWPASADPGAWLNRPMRAELGLPSPEEKIGQAAHDFVAMLGATQVYLTRAAKIDGVPTVPSRWLLRLTALLDGTARRLGKTAREMLTPTEPWLAWAAARDAVERLPAQAAPAPCPVVAWRPRKLPVTAVERWLANPYAIYAQHILRLEKLDAIGGSPGAALRGQIVHDALHRFAQRYPSTLPADIAARLLEDAAAAMRAYAAHPRVAAFWLPRFERFANWFAETEPSRREGMERTIAEVEGSLVLAAPGGPFTLRARADRMDIGGRRLTITDYKTGRAPSDKSVIAGTSPQLSLEAAIALSQGFTGIAPETIAALAYVRVSGGEPPGEYRVVKDDPAALAKAARLGLERLIAAFDRPETPYRAVRRRAFADSYDYDDYAHLARVAEWSQSAEAGEEA